jgi:hypothetical protein
MERILTLQADTLSATSYLLKGRVRPNPYMVIAHHFFILPVDAHKEKGNLVNKLILASALALALSPEFSSAKQQEKIPLDTEPKKDDGKLKIDDACIPQTRVQKLAAMGLTVNTKETATAVRYSYGQKPPQESANCHAAQRRLKQIKKQEAKRQRAEVSPSQASPVEA